MVINNKKLSALSFTLMLVLSIVAFGYLLGSETKMVSAADSTTSTIKVLRADSSGEYIQVPEEIYSAASTAANGDSARTALLLGIWSKESGGSYTTSGNKDLFSGSTYKIWGQNLAANVGLADSRTVGPWEQGVSQYQKYYSSTHNGQTISANDAQKILVSDSSEAAKSANWQLDQSINSIQNKYTSAGREFSLYDPVVQEAVATDYNAGQGTSANAGNQRVIQTLAENYEISLSKEFVIDGKSGPATYQAMADTYNAKTGTNSIDAAYAKTHTTEVMNSLRADYEVLNGESAPLVGKIEDIPDKADSSDYAYLVGKVTQDAQSQIAPSETSISLSNELASPTAPTTGLTLPADFSTSSATALETHLVQENRYALGSNGNVDEISEQFLLNNGIPESAITSEMVVDTSEQIRANNLQANLVSGAQFDTSKVTVPTNDALNEVMIQNFGYDFQELSSADRAFLEKNGMTEADYNYIQYGEGNPADTSPYTAEDILSLYEMEGAELGLYGDDAAAPSGTGAVPTDKQPADLGSFSTLADRDKIGSLIDSKKSWDSLSATDQTYLTSQGYDSSSWNSQLSSQTISPPSDRGTMDVWGMNMPFWAGHLAQGLTWSLAAIAAIQTLGGVFGMDKEETNALSAASTVGIMAGKMSYALLGKGGALGITGKGSFLGSHNIPFTKTSWGSAMGSPYFSAGVAIVAAWLTYNAMYKKEKTETETVNFQCLPWQAPRGGSDCELCNDGGLPCSEYRCKSLGQSCKLINEGTAVEKCINANPRDVSPPIISPWTQILTSGYRYEGKSSPPGPGVKILANTSNGCLRAFQAIQFGVVTNEPSQCKIDIASTKNYSDMATFMGGDNLYTYNHSEFLSLPRAADFANSSITLENGKEMNLFVRCKDANGNLNSAEYIINVCVDPTPDNTVPEIKATSIKSGNCVAANTDNATVDFYTDEPSTCKWSFTDKDYSTMDYNMSCSSNVYEINALQLYTCSALLTGIARDGTNYYVKCEDQPNAPENERNRNMESYQFSLRGSNPLKLLSIKPNQTIYGAVRPTPVELYTQTLYGCEDNKAVCFYSLENANNYVQFFDTDKVDGIHTQRLDLQDGQHTVYVKCVDAGGNLAENTTSFNLEIDTNSPIVARVYQEDTYLKIVTQRNSECVYTNTNCDYLFQEGTTMPYANTTTHVTQWFSDKSYYIKCRDEFRNEPTDCSTIVRPTDNFL